MCGLVAVYSPQGTSRKTLELLERAGKSIRHRGPDHQGRFSDDRIALYFARLSIQDLSDDANQPFFSEDGKLVLVFNGEIYNCDALRVELGKTGHRFKTSSDTEIVLKSFQEWGPKGLKKMRGMFAFLIWNRDTRSLLYARDRFGIKPLYSYEFNDGTRVFSSEIKAILNLGVKPEVNWESVFKFGAREFVDDSRSTFFEGISSVQPASYGQLGESGRHESTYWTLEKTERGVFKPDDFLGVLTQSVHSHLAADVPIAATISGGLDSSTIAALATRELANPKEFRTYSVVPPGTFDETPWIDELTKKFGFHHSYVNLNHIDIEELVDNLVATHEEPFQYASALYQFTLRRQAANDGVKVLLVGEGADEILAGYRRMIFSYILAISHGLKAALPADVIQGAARLLSCDAAEVVQRTKAHQALLQSNDSGQENKSHFRMFSAGAFERYRSISEDQMYGQNSEDFQQGFVELLSKHVFTRNLPHVLKMEDLNSMAFGIESRTPFVDHVLAETAWSYPTAEFMLAGENKSMLRRAMAGILPKSILDRKQKTNRPGSAVYLMEGPLRYRMAEELLSGPLPETQMLAGDLGTLFEEDLRGRRRQRMDAWFRLYVLSRWMRRHF